MRIELFDARVLAPLTSFLEQGGERSQSFLDRARIPAELISAGGWLSKKQVYDFTLDVVQRSRCPNAVYASYQCGFELEHLGPIADAMRSCKTVMESLELGARLGNIAYEGSEYFLKIDGDTTWFCFRETNVVSEGQPYIMDMTLAVYYHLIRMTADEDWHPERMLTNERASERHRSVQHFEDCQAKFHRRYSALGFPTDFLSRRLPWHQPLRDFDESEAWQFGPEGSAPVVDTLYRLLASRFHYRGLPTLDQVALIAGTSAATLKRKLAAAGMSYRRLLDRLRFDEACEMLSSPQITEREIADELGYSGTNNFVRSFRRMTGITPGQYRRQQFVEDGRR